MATDRIFSNYLEKVAKAQSRGNATEHTYRPALIDLLEGFSQDIHATNEPTKQTKVGKPDIGIYDKKNDVIGYVETKDLGKDLDETEKTEQWRRYRSLPNIILTDYLEFRWYVDGDLKRTARLATTEKGGRLAPDERSFSTLISILEGFMGNLGVSAGTPGELAERMAGMAHHIHDLIGVTYDGESEDDSLHVQLRAFQRMLIPDLSPDAFSDMYAQTIAYGLFAARCAAKSGQGFTRQTARELIPKTNPFLREIFDRIAGAGLPEEVSWLVDDLARLLARADMAEILKSFGKATAQDDPVVYFYENFLSAYDPKLREKRGVYYTPGPVVSFIVRSVDHLLKKTFGRKDGLADSSVRVLDPATGTGSFLYSVIQHIYETVKAQGRAGAWDDVVSTEILPRLFGFELLMAPYTVAHLKLSLELQRLGYRFQSKERLGVYLTNTLEEAVKKAEVLFEEAIAEEGQKAAHIKQKEPIMVVLGNPPYSGHSANKGEWITELMKAYKEGVPGLDKPAQAKWLQDDYVKFIRFGQWRIEKTGQGILAFVTNHGYLDNPTFRGMRRSLMESFDEIHLLDLHGNSKKRETAPDGTPDKNVFDIQQGVSIGLFVKRASSGENTSAKVYHTDLWGPREGKYVVLSERDVESLQWKELSPTEPFYLFVPQDESLRLEYEKFWALPVAMNRNGDPAPGIVTTHDEFAVSWSREEAEEKVERFLKTGSEEEARKLWRLCSQSQWNYDRAKQALSDGKWRKHVVPVLYRPFDIRWTVYDPNVAVHRRERVMRHMLAGKNLGIIFMRQAALNEDYSHFGISDKLVDNRAFYSNKGIMFLSPLWLYPEQDGDLFQEGRKPNLNPDFLKAVKDSLGLSPSPEDIFRYAYAVFHSPTYRNRYGGFLKIDFPRLPLTSDKKLFKALAAKGAELAALHLMESPTLEISPAKFETPGTRLVEKVFYDEKAHQVRINSEQFFSGVEKKVWEFQIGGYQVCEKWMKDRKGRKLSAEDVRHYQKIVAAIHQTIRLMAEIDALIPEWPIK